MDRAAYTCCVTPRCARTTLAILMELSPEVHSVVDRPHMGADRKMTLIIMKRMKSVDRGGIAPIWVRNASQIGYFRTGFSRSEPSAGAGLDTLLLPPNRVQARQGEPGVEPPVAK